MSPLALWSLDRTSLFTSLVACSEPRSALVACGRRPCGRRCLRRNGLEQLSRSISRPRVGRMSQAKRARPPREQHLGSQSCEDHLANSISDLRRNVPDHLARGISEPKVARMSQAKRAGTALGTQIWEDVSGETAQTTRRCRRHRRRRRAHRCRRRLRAL